MTRDNRDAVPPGVGAGSAREARGQAAARVVDAVARHTVRASGAALAGLLLAVAAGVADVVARAGARIFGAQHLGAHSRCRHRAGVAALAGPTRRAHATDAIDAVAGVAGRSGGALVAAHEQGPGLVVVGALLVAREQQGILCNWIEGHRRRSSGGGSAYRRLSPRGPIELPRVGLVRARADGSSAKKQDLRPHGVIGHAQLVPLDWPRRRAIRELVRSAVVEDRDVGERGARASEDDGPSLAHVVGHAGLGARGGRRAARTAALAPSSGGAIPRPELVVRTAPGVAAEQQHTLKHRVVGHGVTVPTRWLARPRDAGEALLRPSPAGVDPGVAELRRVGPAEQHRFGTRGVVGHGVAVPPRRTGGRRRPVRSVPSPRIGQLGAKAVASKHQDHRARRVVRHRVEVSSARRRRGEALRPAGHVERRVEQHRELEPRLVEFDHDAVALHVRSRVAPLPPRVEGEGFVHADRRLSRGV